MSLTKVARKVAGVYPGSVWVIMPGVVVVYFNDGEKLTIYGHPSRMFLKLNNEPVQPGDLEDQWNLEKGFFPRRNS